VSLSLLIVDDEKPTREGLRAALEEKFDVYVAESAESALKLLEKESFDVLLTDLRMPGSDGFQLITRAKSLAKPPVCILMTAYGSEDVAVEAMKRGADDYVAKGRMQIEELELRIQRAMKRQNLEVENRQLHERLDKKYGVTSLVGDSPAMTEVLELLRQVSPTRTTVLITGESGTGKEVVAKTVHQLSPRCRGPWVAVHCAGLPATLLESELFGHEKGAFTGAHERRAGRVEMAQGGTLFLDEIGEIDAVTQVKLLRFLGERTFERIGSSRTLVADVRLVAATNKDLAAMVKSGTFREDLYFRLAVVPIHIPPLRERVSDIPLLATNFLQELAAENSKRIVGIATPAMESLLKYHWPGNVRELRTAIEHAVVLCKSDMIGLRELPASLRTPASEGSNRETREVISAGKLTLKEAERQLLIHALEESNGNRTDAARKLGISRRTLHRKIHEFQLQGH
jgi:two-component system, NtrC family, response regulator AtoC